MHRTIATAALIATAVAGLAGCMTVSPQSASEEGGKLRIVQAPAREALESLRHVRQTPKARRSKEPKATPRPRTEPQPALPYVPLPRLSIPQPALRPAAPPQVPQGPDACSLGRDFDQYQSDDQKVNIC